jgi:hypothetical protein
MSQGFAREARIGVDLHVGETLYFTANDTFEKADYPGLYGVKIIVVGSGGAGGGAAATGSSEKSVGSGGSGGGYAEGLVVVGDLASSETVTVGAGGSGSSGSAGGNGSSSSFGTHVVASGGTGGTVAGPSTTALFFGVGTTSVGVGTSGDLLLTGGPGKAGQSLGIGIHNLGAAGGASLVGQGGGDTRSANSNGDAAPTASYGGGGGGAANGQNAAAAAGGDGADGIVIVEVLYERKIAVDEDIHPQYLLRTEAPAFVGASVSLINNHAHLTTGIRSYVAWEQADFDTDSFWSAGNPTRITIPKTGYYLITGNIAFDLNSTGMRQVIFRQDGTTFLNYVSSGAAHDTADTNIAFAHIFLFEAGDYIETGVFQTSGGDLLLEEFATTLLIMLVGE